jgi:hypothetical protein
MKREASLVSPNMSTVVNDVLTATLRRKTVSISKLRSRRSHASRTNGAKRRDLSSTQVVWLGHCMNVIAQLRQHPRLQHDEPCLFHIFEHFFRVNTHASDYPHHTSSQFFCRLFSTLYTNIRCFK